MEILWKLYECYGFNIVLLSFFLTLYRFTRNGFFIVFHRFQVYSSILCTCVSGFKSANLRSCCFISPGFTTAVRYSSSPFTTSQAVTARAFKTARLQKTYLRHVARSSLTLTGGRTRVLPGIFPASLMGQLFFATCGFQVLWNKQCSEPLNSSCPQLVTLLPLWYSLHKGNTHDVSSLTWLC